MAKEPPRTIQGAERLGVSVHNSDTESKDGFCNTRDQREQDLQNQADQVLKKWAVGDSDGVEPFAVASA